MLYIMWWVFLFTSSVINSIDVTQPFFFFNFPYCRFFLPYEKVKAEEWLKSFCSFASFSIHDILASSSHFHLWMNGQTLKRMYRSFLSLLSIVYCKLPPNANWLKYRTERPGTMLLSKNFFISTSFRSFYPNPSLLNRLGFVLKYITLPSWFVLVKRSCCTNNDGSDKAKAVHTMLLGKYQ